MDKILIRKATLSDLPVLLEFEQGLIKTERPFNPTLAEGPITYYDFGEMISSEDVEVIVATWQSQIVSSGYALVKKAKHYLDHEAYSYLGFMYTHPDFRGKGINSKILEVLKQWSNDKGLSEIRLTACDDNLLAIRAYEKYGFKKHLIEMRLPRSTDNIQ